MAVQGGTAKSEVTWDNSEPEGPAQRRCPLRQSLRISKLETVVAKKDKVSLVEGRKEKKGSKSMIPTQSVSFTMML